MAKSGGGEQLPPNNATETSLLYYFIGVRKDRITKLELPELEVVMANQAEIVYKRYFQNPDDKKSEEMCKAS